MSKTIDMPVPVAARTAPLTNEELQIIINVLNQVKVTVQEAMIVISIIEKCRAMQDAARNIQST